MTMDSSSNAHRVVRPAFLCLVFALSASSAEPVKVVGGYTARAFSDAYVQDATKAAKNSFQRFLENAAPHTAFETVAFETNADLIQALKSKRIDMVGGSPNQIVEISREVPIEPAFVAEGVSGFFHEAVLLVAADSPFTQLKDLEGKTLILLEGAEGGHLRLWLDTWALREAGRPFESFFGTISFGRNGSQATLACFFSKADACLVPRGTFDQAKKSNPQVGLKLRELGSSVGLPAAVLAFRPGFDPKMKALVTEIVTHVQDNVFGQQVMKLFHQKRFILCKPEHLAATAALVREHDERLKAYGNGAKTP